MSKPIDPKAIADSIIDQFKGSKFVPTGDQIDALSEAAARIASSRIRTSDSLANVRRSNFVMKIGGSIKIDAGNNPRKGKQGNVATVNPQSVEIIGYLALEWTDTTGREVPTRVVDHYCDPFLKFIEAVHPFIEWQRQSADELKLSPRGGKERRSTSRRLLAAIPGPKEMVRDWLRMRDHVG